MSPAWYQYKVLKDTARACLGNYRHTHRFYYLQRAMEYTALALRLRRLP